METHEAYQVFRGRRNAGTAPALLTCEHASERLPPPHRWPEPDLRLLGTHWTHDIGARALSVDLAQALGCVAVMSRFTRLLIDPNRPEEHPEALRTDAGGTVHLNREVTAEDRLLRVERYHRAYHRAVDLEVKASTAPVLLAVHTFTPLYMGQRRALEAGVLFDEEEVLAARLAEALAAERLLVALNEPYSGKEGLVYSVDRHARAHARRALEIELRQDLAIMPELRERVVRAVLRALGRG